MNPNGIGIADVQIAHPPPAGLDLLRLGDDVADGVGEVLHPGRHADGGLYSQVHETLNSAGLAVTSTTDKQIGWHLGAGAEIRIAPHTAFFADYRFRFVKWGSTDPNAQPITIPGTTVFPVLENVKLSHEGSMWTSGLAFYF